MILEDKVRNWSRGSGLVKISPSCSLVDMWLIHIVLATTCERKWCNRTDKCFVRGRVRWLVAISMQLLLSSKTLHFICGISELKTKPLSLSSRKRFITAMTSRKAVESAMYSASVVLRAMRLCILEAHIIGHPAYRITYPVRE